MFYWLQRQKILLWIVFYTPLHSTFSPPPPPIIEFDLTLLNKVAINTTYCWRLLWERIGKFCMKIIFMRGQHITNIPPVTETILAKELGHLIKDWCTRSRFTIWNTNAVVSNLLLATLHQGTWKKIIPPPSFRLLPALLHIYLKLNILYIRINLFKKLDLFIWRKLNLALTIASHFTFSYIIKLWNCMLQIFHSFINATRPYIFAFMTKRFMLKTYLGNKQALFGLKINLHKISWTYSHICY